MELLMPGPRAGRRRTPNASWPGIGGGRSAAVLCLCQSWGFRGPGSQALAVSALQMRKGAERPSDPPGLCTRKWSHHCRTQFKQPSDSGSSILEDNLGAVQIWSLRPNNKGSTPRSMETCASHLSSSSVEWGWQEVN